MAKTTAPLLSFGASGQIAQTQVYSKWKGRAYVRRYTVPANPNTTEQQLTRSVFSFLQSVYKFATPDFTAAWEAYANGLVLNPRLGPGLLDGAAGLRPFLGVVRLALIAFVMDEAAGLYDLPPIHGFLVCDLRHGFKWR